MDLTIEDGPDTNELARSSKLSEPLSPSPTNALSDKEAAKEAYTDYKKTWDFARLDDTIRLFQHAVDAAPKPDAFLLGELGSCLGVRYRNQGDLKDLEWGIAAEQDALQLISDGHPDKALQLHNLGCSLRRRYERLGELDDLKSAMTMQLRSVELTPADHPDLSAPLDNLGYLYSLRYGRFGALDDLERSIVNRQRAVELAPDDHPDKPIRLNNLGISLRRRFERLGEPDDLERAITVQRRAVELTPEGHPDLPVRLDNLGYLQLLCYEHFGDLEDLERAIVGQQRAVKLTPDGHPFKPTGLNNLGSSLRTRFEHLREPDDLECAITAQRRAVELTPEGHPDMPLRLDNLGYLQLLRYEHFGDLEDLERAITRQRRAVELTPDGHPVNRIRFRNLGKTLRTYFSRERTKEAFNEVLSCYMWSTAQQTGPPSRRLDTAKYAVQLLDENSEFSTPEALILAHSHILDIIPELAWLGYSVSRRIEESSKLGSLVNTAVQVAVSLGAHAQAIEWLEAGRTLIWSQALSLRDPLDDLAKQLPDLAKTLKHVLVQLRRSNHSSFSSASQIALRGDHKPPASSASRETEHHRGLAIQYGCVLAEVRRQPGFGDFMRPKNLLSLVSTSTLDGPLVFINTDASCCDALALLPDRTLTHVALPSLSLDKAKGMRNRWVAHLQQHTVRHRVVFPANQQLNSGNSVRHILRCLWDWVVHPVLQALGFAKPASGGRLPHMTWCPTGPLTQLPIHAAGLYDQESGSHTYNFVVSSYTPSLSALTRGIDTFMKQSSEASSVLVITQPETPGLQPLPGTIVEGARLREVFSDSRDAFAILNGDEATSSAVIQSLNKHAWLHLACHGSQDEADPLKSAFALHDGPLSLNELMGTTADNAELAFLSACQTAVGDEKIPEESMHLAAGMLAVGYQGVIATMWSIRDDDAPLVVEAYYTKLLELRAFGTLGKAETGAAYALHDATKALREKIGEVEVARWAPFVHFGI